LKVTEGWLTCFQGCKSFTPSWWWHPGLLYLPP